MRRRSALALILAATGCSAEPEYPPRDGRLWPVREQLAASLERPRPTLSRPVSNALGQALKAPLEQCGEYWRTGDASKAATTLPLCEEHARQLLAVVQTEFGTEITLDDVRDPALWTYLHAHHRGTD